MTVRQEVNESVRWGLRAGTVWAGMESTEQSGGGSSLPSREGMRGVSAGRAGRGTAGPVEPGETQESGPASQAVGRTLPFRLSEVRDRCRF